MLNVYLYLLSFLVFSSAAVTTPFLLLNTSEVLADTVVNRLDAPDPKFKVAIHYEGLRFPLFSCLMNTVEFLLILGSKDFTGSMTRVSWKTGDYPHVGMILTPSTESRRIERRFVIWGLSQGVAQMIKLNRFQTVTFTLSWEGKEVGTIDLVAWYRETQIGPTQNLNQQPNLSFVEPSSDLSVFSKPTNNTAENVQDPGVIVQITSMGAKLDMYETFLLIIAVLVDAAEMGATKHLRDYTSPEDTAGVRIGFESAGRSTPYFEVGWLMTAVAMIPNYMIKEGVFREALINIKVDGVAVASGFIRRRAREVGLTNVNSNLSVS